MSNLRLSFIILPRGCNLIFFLCLTSFAPNMMLNKKNLSYILSSWLYGQFVLLILYYCHHVKFTSVKIKQELLLLSKTVPEHDASLFLLQTWLLSLRPAQSLSSLTIKPFSSCKFQSIFKVLILETGFFLSRHPLSSRHRCPLWHRCSSCPWFMACLRLGGLWVNPEHTN